MMVKCGNENLGSVNDCCGKKYSVAEIIGVCQTFNLNHHQIIAVIASECIDFTLPSTE